MITEEMHFRPGRRRDESHLSVFLKSTWFRAKLLSVLAMSAFGLLVSGCSESTTATKELRQKTNTVDNTKRYEARGVIQELKPADHEVVIKHEAITNYMSAMTMPFDVKTTNELAGLSTNDQVTFTLVVSEKEGWVENIKKIGTTTNEASESIRTQVRVARDVQPLNVGDAMPDYSFTNSFGKKISLSDFKGQPYAFTFIFTRCPFPNFCPRMSSNFSDAYEQLKKDTNAPPNWHLISISFDPEFDTSARLHEFSERYHPDPKRWDWATGAMIDIDAITEQFGLIIQLDKGTFNHNLRTVVVGPDGIIRNILIGNEWQPDELVADIIRAPLPKNETEK
jgi:protein SCO1/2